MHLFTGGSSRSTVGVGGDSAGGRLAAVVCHEEPGINYQVSTNRTFLNH